MTYTFTDEQFYGIQTLLDDIQLYLESTNDGYASEVYRIKDILLQAKWKKPEEYDIEHS